MIATIRATDHEDLPALSKFLVRAYKFEPSDFHFDPRLLKRKYLHPRAGWLGSRSYLFERSGKIVAHGGICPVSFRLPTGRIVSGHVIVDWAADSRMPALGVMMYRKLMQTASASFAIGGEPDTRKILPRIGFRHVGDASIYAAWLRPWLEFRTRPSTGRSLLRLLHGLKHPVPNRIRHNSQASARALSRIAPSPMTVRALLILGFFCMITIRDSPRAELSANLKYGFLKQAPSTGIAVPSQMDS
jgi:hypothetical protein